MDPNWQPPGPTLSELYEECFSAAVKWSRVATVLYLESHPLPKWSPIPSLSNLFGVGWGLGRLVTTTAVTLGTVASGAAEAYVAGTIGDYLEALSEWQKGFDVGVQSRLREEVDKCDKQYSERPRPKSITGMDF
jgi:hypothetical protein